jgi:predicted AlkP superfamily phosphohydrolase/phosphomutase
VIPPARVLALGIDAASADLVERWSEDGTMPTLGALRSKALSARVQGVEGFFVGSTWPSFATGLTPAGHGLHYLRQLEVGSYRFYRPAERELIDGEPFWRALSRAGRRVAVLDVPLSRLDRSLNGIQTVEWGGHDVISGFAASPPELATEIERRYGAYPLSVACDRIGRTAAGYRQFVETLVRGVERKATLTADLLARGPWDFFIQVFTEAHCVGHQCWHLHDSGHPSHDPAIAAAIGDPLRRVYQAIDAGLARILREAGDALVLIFSCHGMSHWYGASFLLPDLLVRLGFAIPEAAPPQEKESGPTAAARWVWRRLPASIRSAARPLRDTLVRAEEVARSEPTFGVDRRSRCFPQPNGLAVSGLRLNLRGREPAGMVAPGPEADALLAEIAAALAATRDERTGRPLIRRTWRPRDRYAGPHLEQLPDLLVEWSDEVATGTTAIGSGAGALVRVSSERLGVLEGRNDYGRTGEHRPEGFFLAAGRGIRATRLDRRISLFDLAPTFASLLGVTLGRTDGVPIEELWAPRA